MRAWVSRHRSPSHRADWDQNLYTAEKQQSPRQTRWLEPQAWRPEEAVATLCLTEWATLCLSSGALAAARDHQTTPAHRED